MRLIFVGVIAALLAGCASAPELRVVDNARTYDKPAKAVWEKVLSYFESSSIPVKSRDDENGVLMAQRTLKHASVYADCGDSTLGSIGESTMTVKVSVQSLGKEKSRAIVDVSFSASRHYVGVAKTKVDCVSVGTLEEEILSKL